MEEQKLNFWPNHYVPISCKDVKSVMYVNLLYLNRANFDSDIYILYKLKVLKKYY